MTEESRGKRRKQANPKRNHVDIERVNSLGSEGEDEVGLWSLEPQDCQESLDKTSLTPSEETEEPGSPAHFTRQHSLSPSNRNHWAQSEAETEAEGEGGVTAPSAGGKEGEQESLGMFTHNSDSQNALEDLAHYEFLAQLRKASSSVGLLDHLNQNGTSPMYQPCSRQDELPPAIWSPGAKHRSTEGPDALSVSSDGVRAQQACPFCHRTYQRGASLRDHIRYCQEREGGHMVCPLCGYTATYRAQMERHLTLHNHVQDKSSIPLDQGMENRKFKCLQCGKAFKYKHHLKEHLRIHSGEKPYECSNCKKRFSHSGSYSSHLSSKKCLGGGGSAGGAGSAGIGRGAFNGHVQSSYRNPFPTSPLASGERNSIDKGSLFNFQTQDNVATLGRASEDLHHLSPQDTCQSPTTFSRASDLARLWDPMAELSLRTGGLKRTTLLPFLHSGAKFEQMLQEMLCRDPKRDEDRVGVGEEDRRFMYNGGGSDGKVSPNRRMRDERVRLVDGERGGQGVACRWCSQLFPNTAVLLQHERYLCRMNQETVEVLERLSSKDHSSSPIFFPRPFLQPTENSNPNVVTNGLPGDKSPLLKPYWQSMPQQLLVPMNSPSQPRTDPLSSRPYWTSQDGGSPGQPINPSIEQPLPRARGRVPSWGFGSPLCVDLSKCPPDLASPQNQMAPQHRTSWSADTQSEPLDLSLPRPLSKKEAGNKTANGDSGDRGERRELDNPQLRSPTQPPHLPFHQHPIYRRPGVPAFGGSMYNGFPIFNPMVQASVGVSGHDGVSSISLSRPGFISPMPYTTETEAMFKKIHQDRKALMSEILTHGGLDYFSLIDEGVDGEEGPGRKRLKKTEEGLYACDICEKTFQKSSSLLRHKYEHTGKRPHECKICNKAFKHKHHLIEHSRLHSGEKPYQCDKCGKRFSHSGSYSQHMNHRYAYCSRDQDPDQDPEDGTPGTGTYLGACLAGETPLSTEDTQTPHSLLSDSSLDGAPGGLRGEEEEEDVEDKERKPSDGLVEEADMSLLEAHGRQWVPTHVQESEKRAHRDQNERDRCEAGDNSGTEGADNQLWDRDRAGQNRDMDKCELSLDTNTQ